MKFQYEVGLLVRGLISLASQGYKEDIEKLGNLAESESLLQYLSETYKDNLWGFEDLSSCIYDVDGINKYLANVSFLFGPNDPRRKYGIVNQDDGLLFVASLLTEC